MKGIGISSRFWRPGDPPGEPTLRCRHCYRKRLESCKYLWCRVVDTRGDDLFVVGRVGVCGGTCPVTCCESLELKILTTPGTIVYHTSDTLCGSLVVPSHLIGFPEGPLTPPVSKNLFLPLWDLNSVLEAPSFLELGEESFPLLRCRLRHPLRIPTSLSVGVSSVLSRCLRTSESGTVYCRSLRSEVVLREPSVTSQDSSSCLTYQNIGKDSTEYDRWRK